MIKPLQLHVSQSVGQNAGRKKILSLFAEWIKLSSLTATGKNGFLFKNSSSSYNCNNYNVLCFFTDKGIIGNDSEVGF